MTALGKIGVGLALTGVAYGIIVAVRQKQLLEDTEIDYAGFNINSISANRASILLRMKITNKSSIGYSITGQKYDAFINGKKAAQVRSIKDTIVSPKSSAISTVEIIFDPTEVFATGLAAIMKSGLKNVSIRIKGSLSILSSFIVIGSMPVDETFKLSDL